MNEAPYPIGLTIVDIKPISKFDLEAEGWETHQPPMGIYLSDGSVLYPSADYEGNYPGAIFGKQIGADKDTVTHFAF